MRRRPRAAGQSPCLLHLVALLSAVAAGLSSVEGVLPPASSPSRPRLAIAGPAQEGPSSFAVRGEPRSPTALESNASLANPRAPVSSPRVLVAQQWPGAVFIQNAATPLCTGVFVRPTVVLTAGRCLDDVTTTFSGRPMSASLIPRVTVAVGPSLDDTSGAFEVVADATNGSLLWAPGFHGRNVGLLQVALRPAVTRTPTIYRMLFDAIDITLWEPEFPFTGWVAGWGAGQVGETVLGGGVHRSAQFVVTNTSFNTGLSARCSSVVRGGAWRVDHDPNDAAALRVCVGGGDLGAPLFITLPSAPQEWVVVGIAAQGDGWPCSNSSSWFTSLAFAREWVQDQLSAYVPEPPAVCISPSPTPSVSATPTPSISATPTPSTSASPIVPLLFRPPAPDTGLTPLEIAMIVLGVLVFFGSIALFLYYYIFVHETHRLVVPTTLGVLVIPALEEKTHRELKRAELARAAKEEHHEHTEPNAECAVCKAIAVEKEKERLRRAKEPARPDDEAASAAPAVADEASGSALDPNGDRIVQVDAREQTAFVPDRFLGEQAIASSFEPSERPVSTVAKRYEAVAPRPLSRAGELASQAAGHVRLLDSRGHPSAILDLGVDDEGRRRRAIQYVWHAGRGMGYANVWSVVPLINNPESDTKPLGSVPHDVLRALDSVDDQYIDFVGRAVDVRAVRDALEAGNWERARAVVDRMLQAQTAEHTRRLRGRAQHRDVLSVEARHRQPGQAILPRAIHLVEEPLAFAVSDADTARRRDHGRL